MLFELLVFNYYGEEKKHSLWDIERLAVSSRLLEQFDKDLQSIKSTTRKIITSHELLTMTQARLYADVTTPPKFNVDNLVNLSDAIISLQLMHMDISIGTKHFVKSYTAKNEVELAYFARVLSLHYHELFKQVTSLASISVRYYLHDKSCALLIEEIVLKRRELNKLKEGPGRKLEEIRNKLIAHKDGTGYSQYKKTRELDFVEILEICVSAHYLYTRILELLMKLVNKQLKKAVRTLS